MASRSGDVSVLKHARELLGGGDQTRANRTGTLAQLLRERMLEFVVSVNNCNGHLAEGAFGMNEGIEGDVRDWAS